MPNDRIPLTAPGKPFIAKAQQAHDISRDPQPRYRHTVTIPRDDLRFVVTFDYTGPDRDERGAIPPLAEIVSVSLWGTTLENVPADELAAFVTAIERGDVE